MKDKERTNSKKIKTLTQKMQRRLSLVFVFFLLGFVGLIGRIVYLNTQDKYAKGALELQSYVSSEIVSKRGDILDRNGQILATSELEYNLFIDPKVITYNTNYIEPTIYALLSCFDLDEASLREILEVKKASSYVVVKRHVSYEQRNAYTEFVNNMDAGSKKLVKGVYFEESYKRVYPFSTLASHVIGFTVGGDQGSYGIEQYYNDELTGTNGRVYGYFDGNLDVVETRKEAVDGNTIMSTIDINVQRIVEKYTEQFLDEYGAKNVGVVVMDANSAEILAMQSNHSFDLNNPRDLSVIYSEEEIAQMSDEDKVTALYDIWRNFCINDAYEPGSIYKPFTVAGALEEAQIQKSSRWECDGGEDFAGDVRIKCSNTYGHGEISLVQSLMMSCNDALMQIASIEGKNVFFKYQNKFGIGQKTGIDLPGEATGQSFNNSELNETELATSSFGQGFTTTMVQMAAAFCTLINGGNYYEPHVVKSIKNADGATLKRTDALLVEKTISEATGDFIKDALYLTVSGGTGKKASIDGYLIGGKTGTSQKLPREAEKYVISFLGFVESEEMDIVIYVVIDECSDPAKATRCATAMKVFTDIAEEALPYLKVYPEGEIDYKIRNISENEILVDENNTTYDPLYDEGVIHLISR